MSRIIKFRAWDKDEEKMDYDVAIVGNRILFEYDIDTIDDSIEVSSYVDIDEDNEKYFEVMQYTGLKDKNDKEIYEGDIINIINNSFDEEDGYFIVKYDIGTARYILSGNGLIYDFDNTYTNECEVIGNIYKNPNLPKEA